MQGQHGDERQRDGGDLIAEHGDRLAAPVPAERAVVQQRGNPHRGYSRCESPVPPAFVARAGWCLVLAPHHPPPRPSPPALSAAAPPPPPSPPPSRHGPPPHPPALSAP